MALPRQLSGIGLGRNVGRIRYVGRIVANAGNSRKGDCRCACPKTSVRSEPLGGGISAAFRTSPPRDPTFVPRASRSIVAAVFDQTSIFDNELSRTGGALGCVDRASVRKVSSTIGTEDHSLSELRLYGSRHIRSRGPSPTTPDTPMEWQPLLHGIKHGDRSRCLAGRADPGVAQQNRDSTPWFR
jgi:hypothetical protein